MCVVVLFIWVIGANAQNFEFQYNGESLVDGSTVRIAAVEKEDGKLYCTTNPISNPDKGLILKLLNVTMASGRATMNINTNVLSTSSLNWRMGGESEIMYHELTLDKNFSTTNGIVQVQFDAEDIQNQGALIATLSATIDGETHTVRILFSSVSASTDGLMWWGYFAESDIKDGYSSYGNGKKEDFDAAIFIPSNHAIAGGGSIKGIRIWLDSGLSSIWPSISEVKVWISKNLPEKLSDADFVQEVNLATLKEGFNQIILDTPYSIQEQGSYVGYSIVLDLFDYPIMAAGNGEENAFFIRSTESDPIWHQVPLNKLGLQVLLDGKTFPDHAVIASDFGKHIVEKGKDVSIPVRIKNIGISPIDSISYTITTNNHTTAEETLPIHHLPFINDIDISISFQADEDARWHEKTLAITKVNGKANEASVPTAEGSLITILERPVPVPVVEEFTGTWCGWCPIGIDGMQKTKDVFGDEVVLIAVHSSDVMQTYDYAPITNTVSSYPNSRVNRLYDIYPEASNLENIVSKELDKTTLGSISLDAEWNSAEQTAVEIVSKTRFVYSDDNGQYGIAYVLVEDGLKGPDSEWCQTNYLSNNEEYKDFSFWYHAPSKVSGLEFNHVPVAAWNIKDGDEIKSDFIAGEVIENKFEADISANTLIQDKSKLTVVALLIDQTTGAIMNSAQTTIQDASSGIAAVCPSPTRVVGYYNAEGKRFEAPVKGLNIIIMDDGKVKKAMGK